MSHTTADLPDLSLPPQDADIRHALADVEARLSAWTAAIAAVQDSLPSGTPPGSAEDESTPSVAAPGTALSNPSAEIPSAAPEQAKAPMTASAAVEPSPASPAGTKDAPIPKNSQPPAAPVPPAEHTAPHRGTKARQKAPAIKAPSKEDDEALLASLDPETAKAIRIMRRLSFEKKSVRELLEEYKATNSGPGPADNQKKSWWSRG